MEEIKVLDSKTKKVFVFESEVARDLFFDFWDKLVLRVEDYQRE